MQGKTFWFTVNEHSAITPVKFLEEKPASRAIAVLWQYTGTLNFPDCDTEQPAFGVAPYRFSSIISLLLSKLISNG